MLVAMLAGCTPVAPAATAPAAGGEAAAGDMPYAGTTLRLVGANHPWQVAITPLLAEFEAATGVIRYVLDHLGCPHAEIDEYIETIRRYRYRQEEDVVAEADVPGNAERGV